MLTHDSGTLRTELELSASGLAWSERRREWVSEEEAEDEAGSTTTAVEPFPVNTFAPRIKLEDEEADREECKIVDTEKSVGKVEVIWIEWDGEHDVQHPFNDSSKWTTTLICKLMEPWDRC